MRQVPLILALLLCAGCDGLSSNSEGNSRRLDRIAAIYAEGNTATTIPLLVDYLKTYPRDGLAWTILGHAYNDEDRIEDAQSAYESAIAVNPEQFQAITGLGVIYRKQGNYDAAMNAYERAVKIDPTFAQAYSSMTTIALKRNDDSAALEYARKGYDLDSTDPVIAANLALAYHYNNDFEQRDEFTRIAERLGYENVERLQQLYSGELTIRD